MLLKYFLWPTVLCLSLLLIDTQEAGNPSPEPANIFTNKLDKHEAQEGLVSSDSRRIETRVPETSPLRATMKIHADNF